MAKHKKQTVHMIDMSNRLNVKIVHEEYTLDDQKQWEEELKKIDKKNEERMKKYEEDFKLFIDSVISDTSVPKKDADYFIREYKDKFDGRNQDHVKNRIDFYNKLLEEYES